MCESAVYLVKGTERTLVMKEAARIIVTSQGVVCVDTLGGRTAVDGAELVEANLLKHEIVLQMRQG